MTEKSNDMTGSSSFTEFPAKFAIILCGGSGKRAGGTLPKQFVEVDKVPVLAHSMRTFHLQDNETKIILVLPEEYVDYWNEVWENLDRTPTLKSFKIPHIAVVGGSSRMNSVMNGLNAVNELMGENDGDALVAIHDGARPYLNQRLLVRGWRKCLEAGTAIPAVPLTDSIRMLKGEGDTESVAVDRSRYVAVQTPQIFRLSLLNEAYSNLPEGVEFTDDASVVERIVPCELYQGDSFNTKITNPRDLKIARTLLKL
ncbi:MAG: 2-C-methyl-D-erythritol 4-phosphate cytidylyltransferase [Muribaculaceae bacterium]|nr:2-C-methyl-D-erythritol 4-phosphate cytidylyltransferase [Muribaculaceae bacterium]